MTMKGYITLFALVLALTGWTPGLRAQNFYVIGATVHTGTGQVIEQGAISVENGRIAAVADARLIRIDPAFGPVIDAAGLHVYPGLVAANTTLGLTEVDYLRQTKDYQETGQFNPHVRALIAYNAASRVIPTVRSNGVLYAQITPRGGYFAGKSSVVKLEAWNWEEAAIVEDDGIHLHWPALYRQGGWWADPGSIDKQDDYENRVAEIDAFLEKAWAYCENEGNGDNVKFGGMCPLFNGEMKLYIHTHGAYEMARAIEVTDRWGITDRVIVGGRDALKVAGLLKEKDIPVILEKIHALPAFRHSDLDQWYALPAQLHEAGVRFCLSFSGPNATYYGAWEQRNLPFHAGTAVAYGLDSETALAAVTSFPAEILGADNIGSIEPGKDASFLLSEGDLLDMRTSKVVRAWIAGKEVNLDDKHQELYRKYRERYEREGWTGAE